MLVSCTHVIKVNVVTNWCCASRGTYQTC